VPCDETEPQSPDSARQRSSLPEMRGRLEKSPGKSWVFEATTPPTAPERQRSSPLLFPLPSPLLFLGCVRSAPRSTRSMEAGVDQFYLTSRVNTSDHRGLLIEPTSLSASTMSRPGSDQLPVSGTVMTSSKWP
jgi:hypothetical protein